MDYKYKQKNEYITLLKNMVISQYNLNNIILPADWFDCKPDIGIDWETCTLMGAAKILDNFSWDPYNKKTTINKSDVQRDLIITISYFINNLFCVVRQDFQKADPISLLRLVQSVIEDINKKDKVLGETIDFYIDPYIDSNYQVNGISVIETMAKRYIKRLNKFALALKTTANNLGKLNENLDIYLVVVYLYCLLHLTNLSVVVDIKQISKLFRINCLLNSYKFKIIEEKEEFYNVWRGKAAEGWIEDIVDDNPSLPDDHMLKLIDCLYKNEILA